MSDLQIRGTQHADIQINYFLSDNSDLIFIKILKNANINIHKFCDIYKCGNIKYNNIFYILLSVINNSMLEN